MPQPPASRGPSARAARHGAPGPRVERLTELLREEVNLLLRDEVRDARLESVVVTRVEMVGSCARMWYVAEPGLDASRALVNATGFLRSRLCEILELKRIPELRFRPDPSAGVLALLEQQRPSTDPEA